jgi:hypothetical protein
VFPPGANGTTIVTGRVGHPEADVSAALVCVASADTTASKCEAMKQDLRVMAIPLGNGRRTPHPIGALAPYDQSNAICIPEFNLVRKTDVPVRLFFFGYTNNIFRNTFTTAFSISQLVRWLSRRSHGQT